MDGEAIRVRRRWLPRWLRLALAALLVLLLIAFAIVWAMRVELARGYIDGELARRGVVARYDVKRIGFGNQIFENLAIGDPRHPDLTARHVEVQVRIGFTGPYVGLITARGVRLQGRIESGQLKLGEVDKLLPPPTGEPFRLPDQRIDVRDSALILQSPAGQIIVAVAGRGNLSDGFRGGLAIGAGTLRLGACVIERPMARFMVKVRDARPRVHGPAAMRSFACGSDLRVDRPLFALRSQLGPALDSWHGSSGMRVARFRSGGQSLSDFEGQINFDGNADLTRGDVALLSGAAAAGPARAGHVRFAGQYSLARRGGDVLVRGRIGASGLTTDGSSAISALRAAAGTPVEPIGAALAEAVRRASALGAAGDADVLLAGSGGRGGVRLTGVTLQTLSGARLTASAGNGITYVWPAGALALDGDFALSGGGFPDARFALSQAAPGASLRGTGRIAPMRAGAGRLALGEIAFTAAPDGTTRFRTVAAMDGPIGGAGRVSNLVVPIAGRFGTGGFALGETCVAASFAALQVQNLRLGPARLPLCPVGGALLRSGRRGLEGGAEIRAPRFAGRLGSSPITVAADRLRVDLAGFTAARLAVRLAANTLDIASLSGRFAGGGVTGRFEGLAGDLANVPLLASEGRGTWRFARGALSADGHIALADRQAPARFTPLASDNFHFYLAGNRIEAGGWLVHPASGTRVVAVELQHDLASGTGRADLDVEALRFTPGGLQPDTLTPLTIGVVASVDGALSGQGRIEWDGRGVRSIGSFTTEDMDLAAPFGPVEGLATRIDFTDLLGLTSAPGQEARVRLVQAGVDVFDGVVRYQIRPNYQVAIEDARWPLAGGTLSIEPTTLDFASESTKYLTFRVEGLDAARFIQLMEFSNIDATGTYDGIIPMQFTDRGGRIVGGRLVARPGGGTLSYIGQLSEENLGVYGKLAFDALKSLRYSRLEISLEGALDGEFLTRIDMDGVARDLQRTRTPQSGIAGMLVGRVLNQVARIPFHFNIRIEGRFRSLIATARSFEDPSELIRAALPQLLQGRTPPDSPVQPHESEPVP